MRLPVSGASMSSNVSKPNPSCNQNHRHKHDVNPVSYAGTNQNCTIFTIRTRDVNFVFFQKSIIVLKKSIFFDYRIWASLTVGRTKTCWDAVTDAGTVVACPPGVALPLATATAGNNPGSRIGHVLHVLVIA